MVTFLTTVLVLLISALTAALIGVALRPRRDDAMPRRVGDAPRFVRGGYSALPGNPPYPPLTDTGVMPPSASP
jgi:hypothetical protein